MTDTFFVSSVGNLDEAAVRRAVAAANVPALLMVVFQVTGDPKWLEDPFRPTRTKGLGDHDTGGLSDENQLVVREAAVTAILDLQAGRQPAIPVPSPDLTVRMMSVCVGEEVSEEYGPMFSEEFARRTRVSTSVDNERKLRATVPENFKAVIIGAGVAGIVAAKILGDMGIDYTILEKASSPGGTWRQNKYPGAGVDTPSHLYSFSFAQHDWAKHFELGEQLHHYMKRVIKDTGAEANARYNTEVVAAAYREDSKIWNLEIRTEKGTLETLEANVVISAVGPINQPKVPNLPGLETFDGPSFHTAEWPEDVDLEGKRVAIVGTGASSMQVVPAIADHVEHLTIFQRTPQWVAPFEKFEQAIPNDLRTLLKALPMYHGWYWLRLFWQFGDKVLDALRKDPEWAHPERSVNARNDGHREFFIRYLKEEIGERQDLLDKAIPDYPPFGKRILLDNGWYRTLRKPNVTLVNEAVSEVRPDRVVADSGDEHQTDVLIWATGFDVARFVSTMDVRGVRDKSLREAWNDDDPRTFLGISVPDFPNFFMLGGPHSFPGSGTFMFFMEVQMRYIADLLRKMFDESISALDARAEVTNNYNELVDKTHEGMVWTHPGMETYYRNSAGRVIYVMPFRNIDYWYMTREAKLEDYTPR